MALYGQPSLSPLNNCDIINRLHHQLPEGLRGKFFFRVESDAYRLKWLVALVEVETSKVWRSELDENGLLPREFIARLCILT
jgi:hypothetical protein